MNRFRQRISLSSRLLKLKARNFFLLSTGDSLRAVTLRREIRASNLSEKTKKRMIKSTNKLIKKHVDFVESVMDAENHPEDY